MPEPNPAPLAGEPNPTLTPTPTPTPAPAPTPDPTATWLDELPEAIRGEKTLSKFKDPAALAQSYINLERHAGGAVRIPGPNASPDEIKAFHQKLGVPETADAYGIETRVPETVPWDRDAEKKFLARAHALGLTKTQAQGILDDYVGQIQTSFDTMNRLRAEGAEQAFEVVRGEWGALTDRNVALVQRAVAEFGGDEFREYLDTSGAGNDPRFLKFVYAMATPLLEDNLIQGENLGMRKTDAQSQIAKLMAEPGFLAGDKAIVEKIRALTEIAHG